MKATAAGQPCGGVRCTTVDARPCDEDVLTREHANFHEPLAVGAAVRHEVTGEPAARDAARNLLGMLRRTRSYATGGTCDGERWQAPGQLAGLCKLSSCSSEPVSLKPVRFQIVKGTN